MTANETLRLRPPRGRLLPLLAAVALLALVAVIVTFRTSMTALVAVIWIGPLIPLASVLTVLRGRTEVTSQGIGNRLDFRETFVPWKVVKRFQVRPRGFSQKVMVVRTDGRKMELAAPRTGLFRRCTKIDGVLRAVLELAPEPRPEVTHSSALSRRLGLVLLPAVLIALLWPIAGALWPGAQPWWPGRAEATAVPHACAVADQSVATRLLGRPHKAGDNHDTGVLYISSYCYWTGPLGGLSLRYHLSPDVDAQDGIADARKEFGGYARNSDYRGAQARPGLGDQALISAAPGRRLASARLLVRRANLLIEIFYYAGRPADQVDADAEGLARAALARVRFS